MRLKNVEDGMDVIKVEIKQSLPFSIVPLSPGTCLALVWSRLIIREVVDTMGIKGSSHT